MQLILKKMVKVQTYGGWRKNRLSRLDLFSEKEYNGYENYYLYQEVPYGN